MNNIKELAEKYKPKLENIKVCAFDVDGILTDGKILWSGDDIGFNRSTNTRDGYGMRILQDLGFKVGVITGGNSLSIDKRFIDDMAADFCYKGSMDKRSAYLDILKKENCSDENILYMGDDLIDIPILKRCGFSATVSVASLEVKEVVDYICETAPGEGCVREVIDMLILAQGLKPKIIDFGD